MSRTMTSQERKRAFANKMAAQRKLAGRSNRDALIDMQRDSRRQTVVVQVPRTQVSQADERKYVDGYLDLTNFHELGTNDDTWADCELNPRQQTSVYGCLPVPRQGTGYGDRSGRKIVIKKIVIRGIINWTGADTITATSKRYPIVRLLVVKDTKTNGAEMAAEDCIGPGLGS